MLGKGNKERIVPVPPPMMAFVAQYLDMTYEGDSPYLFPSNNVSGYWGIRNFEKSLHRVCKRAGIKPDITPHQLRHFFTTDALRKGTKLEVISRILRHASIAITADIYHHVLG